MNLTSQSTLYRNPEIICSKIDDEAVMMDIESGSYFGLNKTATVIWDSLADAKPVSEIIEILQQHFQVDLEQCSSESMEFIQDLINKKLILKK